MNIEQHIRTIPDFPKPGIQFKDITPLLNNAKAFKSVIDLFQAHYRDVDYNVIAGIESRGFIFGAALAVQAGKRFIPIRKPGKLPADTFSHTYELEYGSDSIEIHQDACGSKDRVLLIDDLLATGGTISAAEKLITQTGAAIAGIAFVIELGFLNGREKIGSSDIYSIVSY